VPAPAYLGRYRLIRPIARGGVGEVHLGVLEAPGGVRRLAALKVLLDDSPERQAALLAEAKLAALIAHPNVAHLFDAGHERGLAWFAMEYVPGLSLAEVLDYARGRLPHWIWVRIMAEACAAVHSVHEARDERGAPLDVVHRDVTPQNLLVNWDGCVKLVDFGIARSSLGAARTTTGVVKGKLGYMSPEQASGGALDRRTDVFALGVLLFEGLAGRRPFQGATEAETMASIVRGDAPRLAAMKPELPPALGVIADRALSRNPSTRYATALEMERGLELALYSSGVVIGPNEVAHVLAKLAPDRVREHQGWLSEGESSDGGARPGRAASGSRASRSPPSGVPRPWSGRRSSAARFVAGLLVGVLISAGTLALLRGKGAERAASEAPPRRAQEPTLERTKGDDTAPSTPATSSNASGAIVSAGVRPLPTSTGAPPGASARARREPKPETEAAPGALHVSARPTWATIVVDGNPVGATPLVVSQVAAGKHLVEALPAGRGPGRVRTVMVPAGGVTRLEFRFDEADPR
jgi:eukaryotic-like serine/threonine-protein kinase